MVECFTQTVGNTFWTSQKGKFSVPHILHRHYSSPDLLSNGMDEKENLFVSPSQSFCAFFTFSSYLLSTSVPGMFAVTVN